MSGTFRAGVTRGQAGDDEFVTLLGEVATVRDLTQMPLTFAMSLTPDVVSDLSTLVAAVPQPTTTGRDLQAFVRALLERVPAEDLPGRPVAEWLTMATHLLKYFRERKPGQAKVRVYNPTLEEHGYASPHTVIEVVTEDSPFLIDSVSMAIAQSRLLIHLIAHPVVSANRDAGGYLLDFGGDAGKPESLSHFEIDREIEPELLNSLRVNIEKSLRDVRVCVRDFAVMKAHMATIAASLPGNSGPHDERMRHEAAAFLTWLTDDHFTFLGSRSYEARVDGGQEVLAVVSGSGLGILSGDETNSRPTAQLVARVDGEIPDPVILTKTNARSTVHHPGYMDYVGVLIFDESSRAFREERFLGSYTSNALTCPLSQIPMVRLKVEAIVERSGLRPSSHSGKSLLHILESLPREEVFQSSVEELYHLAMGVLHLHERQRTRVFCRRDRYGRFWSVLVYVPRDRLTPTTRDRIELMLKQSLNAERIDSTIHVSDKPLARLFVVVRPSMGSTIEIDPAAIESQVIDLVRNWHDEVREALIAKHGEGRGQKLAQKFGRALPASYIEESSPSAAARDVEMAAGLKDFDDIALSLERPRRSDAALRLKIFKYGKLIALSDVLPVLENLGLRVLTEHPHQVDLPSESLSIQDFEVGPAGNFTIDIDDVRERFIEAFIKIWRGDAESDGFNQLVLSAGFDLRQTRVLRAYCKYLLQTGLPFSQPYIERAMQAHPITARVLIELFDARFDPAHGTAAGEAALTVFLHRTERLLGSYLEEFRDAIDRVMAAKDDRAEQMHALSHFITQLLDKVNILDEDRIFRAFKATILATLRTNAFQKRDGATKSYLSLKFDSGQVPDLPKPIPHCEIFVYSPRVEGVHLRFGKVARGGLRWSDRREDFRTEVLGLVKAQQVKNTVIVPVGAKGGFYVKQRPAEREAVLAEGVACYRTFISGLLDITDNVIQGQIVPAAEVVRYDDVDPYLVVAADKGTATFSDIANAISGDYGFWLGDAFASGGSKGYDHKKMGITAKGAWESVKRHFRAQGRDCQTEPFTCVGVGDMSGDVFGNGMLLSRQIRILAAFDHRHIFVDPNPDPEVSFVERERLFALPRSSWEDYASALISAGGEVYSRDAKTITISEAARVALDLPEGGLTMTPTQLMHGILKAPADLLWNGGIGTYVKASSESHLDCGDRANNAIRVDGNQVRAKVIGEGGNLGCTQLGRIEYAQAGGLCNTDFIDNSAGVDTSDHEVNIKILLSDALEHGTLAPSERDQLLVDMTDEVGELVIFDNYRQNHAITLMRELSLTRLGAKHHFIRTLEAQGALDRDIEFLPSDAELIDRKARGLGLTRPELSVLLSYAKIQLYQQLLDSNVPEDAYLSRELEMYFPTALRSRFKDSMQRHRLKREIIATQVCNSIVNRMGATFVLRMTEDTGQSPGEVARAFTIARDILDARSWWTEIDRLAFQIDAAEQLRVQLRIWLLLRSFTRWLLNRPGASLDIAQCVAQYGPGLQEVMAGLPELVSAEDAAEYWAEESALVKQGFGTDFARSLSRLPALTAALDILETAFTDKLDIKRVGKVYFDLSEALHLAWFRDQIEALPVEGRWHANARGALRDELNEQLRELTALLLTRYAKVSDKALVGKWLSTPLPQLEFVRAMLGEMRSQRALDYPTASVAVRRLSQLVNAQRRL